MIEQPRVQGFRTHFDNSVNTVRGVMISQNMVGEYIRERVRRIGYHVDPFTKNPYPRVPRPDGGFDILQLDQGDDAATVIGSIGFSDSRQQTFTLYANDATGQTHEITTMVTPARGIRPERLTVTIDGIPWRKTPAAFRLALTNNLRIE